MTGEDDLEVVVDHVSELLLERIGLRVDRTLRGRVRRAIRDEAIERATDPITYARMLTSPQVLQGLLNRVTVQETAFFRHPEHLDVLAGSILPALPRPVTIWSAGCANGQEAFTLAMVLEEQGIDGSVVATDLSTAALRRSAAARYTSREMSGLSSERVSRHMRRVGADWEVARPVRDRVRVLQHNLLDPLLPILSSCQVVFCRNVLIYLSPAHARAFLDRIADGFPATTSVFLGAAETMWQVSTRFRAVPIGNTFIYRSTRGVDTAAPDGTPRRVATTPARAGVAPATRRAPAPERARAEHRSPPTVELLARSGQEAAAAGDYHAAVVAFRKCAYLLPSDPVTQLHLGLALEAVGDRPSAHRAFASARRSLLTSSGVGGHAGHEGYAPGELIRMLDVKLGVQPL